MDQQAITVMQEAQLDPTTNDVPLGMYRKSNGRIEKIQRTRAIAKKPDLNNFAPMPGNTRGYPFNDEIIIKVDRFSDEATCKACNGTGHSDSTCPDCGGMKGTWYDPSGNKDNRSSVDRSGFSFKQCVSCRAAAYSDPIPRSTGRVPCKPCKGQGQAVGESSIAISTAYEDVPTTGIVLAIGPAVKRVSRGMRVLFSRFAGQEYEVDGRKYRIMKDMYPMMEVRGNGEVRVREAATLG